MTIGICVSEIGGYGDIVAALEIAVRCHKIDNSNPITMVVFPDDNRDSYNDVIEKLATVLGIPLDFAAQQLYYYKNVPLCILLAEDLLKHIYKYQRTRWASTSAIILREFPTNTHNVIKDHFKRLKKEIKQVLFYPQEVIPNKLILAPIANEIVTLEVNISLPQFSACCLVCGYTQNTMVYITEYCNMCIEAANGDYKTNIESNNNQYLTPHSLFGNISCMRISPGFHLQDAGIFTYPEYQHTAYEAKANNSNDKDISLCYLSNNNLKNIFSNFIQLVIHYAVKNNRPHHVHIISNTALDYQGVTNDYHQQIVSQPTDTPLVTIEYHHNLNQADYQALLFQSNCFTLVTGNLSFSEAISWSAYRGTLVLYALPSAIFEEIYDGFIEQFDNCITSDDPASQDIENLLIPSTLEDYSAEENNSTLQTLLDPTMRTTMQQFCLYLVEQHDITTAIREFLALPELEQA